MLCSIRTCGGFLRSRRFLQLIFLVACLLTVVNVTLFWPEIQYNFPSEWLTQSPNPNEPKLAFATILSSYNKRIYTADEPDDYFVSVRLLNYQIQHDKVTRTKRQIPFLVLVTPDILPWKRQQLEKEGATVVPVDKIVSHSMKPGIDVWGDAISKLKVFELIGYDRILFLDADTFLLKSLDRVFKDRAAKPQNTLDLAPINPDEAPLPESYLISTNSEAQPAVQSDPPLEREQPSFNAGFFLLAPSIEMFNYYTSLLNMPGLFNGTYTAQHLLDYAHRPDGNMPYSRISRGWNIDGPKMNVKTRVASIHAKLWSDENTLEPNPPGLQDLWYKKRTEMERYYWARQDAKAHLR